MTSDVDRYYPTKGRVILHIDMNAFYCSVHAAHEPALYAGKPTAVSGSVEKRKGIIVTCSYEARHKKVKTGMSVKEALRYCPELILITPDFDLYRKYSKQFIEIAKQYTPIVEVVSIDECYMDITGSKLLGTPLDIAKALQKQIRDELNIPCSIGIAPNKLLAKMGSDMKKPNGLTVLRLRDVKEKLWPQPCQYLFGLGPKTAEKLKRVNINTIGQLAMTEESYLRRLFGVYGTWLHRAANGYDDQEVKAEQEQSKSIGHATTLPADVTELTEIQRILLSIADQVGRRMRKQKLLARTIQLTIRRPDMTTIQRSVTLQSPTHNMDIISAEANKLLLRHWNMGDPIRLLGISASNLVAESEAVVALDLFNYEEEPKKEALIKVMDELRDKYGENTIVKAGMLQSEIGSRLRDKKRHGTSLEKVVNKEEFES